MGEIFDKTGEKGLLPDFPKTQRLVYLAGPVSHLSGKEAISWREYAAEELWRGKYHVLSPLRGKEALLDLDYVEPHGYDGKASDQALYRMCKWDVKRCDVVLVNLVGATRVSIGTCFEMAWAEDAGKMVVVCMEDDNPHRHAFPLQSASIRFPTLDEGIKYINEVL